MWRFKTLSMIYFLLFLEIIYEFKLGVYLFLRYFLEANPEKFIETDRQVSRSLSSSVRKSQHPTHVKTVLAVEPETSKSEEDSTSKTSTKTNMYANFNTIKGKFDSFLILFIGPKLV
jgi:hypothetical protein